MNIKIEMGDREALENITMLTAYGQFLESGENENRLLTATVEALKGRIFKALLAQVPADRVKEITKS